jgi:NAD-dependent DNA ligase
MADFHAILRSKARELNRSQIDAMTDDQTRAYYWLNKDKWKAPEGKSKPKNVCFTGFTIAEEEALVSVAKGKGLRVSNTVTKSLSYLVTGPNAGPAKLKKAQEQGVNILTPAEFQRL